jgi:hypothetical protein
VPRLKKHLLKSWLRLQGSASPSQAFVGLVGPVAGFLFSCYGILPVDT